MFLFPSKVINKSKFLKNRFGNKSWNIKHLGNPIINDLKVISLKDDPNQKFVIKKYGSIFSLIKWTLIKFFSFYVTNYKIGSENRSQNEIIGLKFCKQQGISAPKFYEKIGSTIIIDFVQGTPIDLHTEFSSKVFFKHFKSIGKLVAFFHVNNAIIGDCKAENILYSIKDKKYYILDLEQFHFTHKSEIKRRVWDITELFFYLGHFYPFKSRYEFLKKIIVTFLTQYFKDIWLSNMDKDIKIKIFNEFGRFRYSIIYMTFMNPFTFKFIANAIKEFKLDFIKNESWKR